MKSMQPYIDSALRAIRKNLFWTEMAIYLVIACGSALWIGRRAYKEAKTLQEEGQRLEHLRVSADRWITTFQPVSSAEAREWQEVQSALGQLGVGADSRLTLVEVITRRAERAGLGNVRAVIGVADPAVAIPRPGSPPITFTVAAYSILVDFTGNLAATRVFLANLPAAVSVQSIDMNNNGRTTGTHAVLTVYESVPDASG